MVLCIYCLGVERSRRERLDAELVVDLRVEDAVGVGRRHLAWARASARRNAGKCSAESARARPDAPSPYGDGRRLVGIGQFWLI